MNNDVTLNRWCYKYELEALQMMWTSVMSLQDLLPPLLLSAGFLFHLQWWGTGMAICLAPGANDLYMVQLIPLPTPIISCSSKIQNGLPFRCRPTQVVVEKRPLNGWSSVILFQLHCIAPGSHKWTAGAVVFSLAVWPSWHPTNTVSTLTKSNKWKSPTRFVLSWPTMWNVRQESSCYLRAGCPMPVLYNEHQTAPTELRPPHKQPPGECQ